MPTMNIRAIKLLSGRTVVLALAAADGDGHWVTIDGEHIFINGAIGTPEEKAAFHNAEAKRFRGKQADAENSGNTTKAKLHGRVAEEHEKLVKSNTAESVAHAEPKDTTPHHSFSAAAQKTTDDQMSREKAAAVNSIKNEMPPAEMGPADKALFHRQKEQGHFDKYEKYSAGGNKIKADYHEEKFAGHQLEAERNEAKTTPSAATTAENRSSGVGPKRIIHDDDDRTVTSDGREVTLVSKKNKSMPMKSINLLQSSKPTEKLPSNVPEFLRKSGKNPSDFRYVNAPGTNAAVVPTTIADKIESERLGALEDSKKTGGENYEPAGTDRVRKAHEEYNQASRRETRAINDDGHNFRPGEVSAASAKFNAVREQYPEGAAFHDAELQRDGTSWADNTGKGAAASKAISILRKGGSASAAYEAMSKRRNVDVLGLSATSIKLAGGRTVKTLALSASRGGPILARCRQCNSTDVKRLPNLVGGRSFDRCKQCGAMWIARPGELTADQHSPMPVTA